MVVFSVVVWLVSVGFGFVSVVLLVVFFGRFFSVVSVISNFILIGFEFCFDFVLIGLQKLQLIFRLRRLGDWGEAGIYCPACTSEDKNEIRKNASNKKCW